uniref:ribosome hibernation-promoting factor, HPF/YfiA family n=1 Tax=Ndongobacter massiliensis TaxID=1871025 RepID=UPI0009303F3B|nr:ribosome-associated translation inhibitor RaiA [Ndongobacter massiliensis]
MNIQYVGRNIQLRDNFKELTAKKLNRLDKYFSEDVNAVVTMSTEGADRKVEVTIRIPGSGTILRAEERSDDMLESVDRAVDALVSQVRKYKTKLRRHQKGNESIRFESVEPDHEEEDTEEPRIVRVKHLELAPMSAEEAVLQMELLGHDFFLFVDAEGSGVNAVYRRKAGDYGLIVSE